MSLAKIGVMVSKNKPMIATVAGVSGVVVAGVMACKATVKVSEVNVEIGARIEAVKESGYTDVKKYRKDLYKTYLAAGIEYARLYGPSVIIGGLAIGSIFYGHNLLNKKTVALAGAYKALTMDFDSYRHRVFERLGEENERSIRYNMRPMDVEVEENGKTVTKTVEVIPEENYGNGTTYRSVFFDETSIYWTKDPEENKAFLLDVQNRAQKKLEEDGYLFLNWVYDQLDVTETYAGAHCGWVMGLGEDRVDFGIYDVYSPASRRFVNGLEPVVLLNFNDDGYIADKI